MPLADMHDDLPLAKGSGQEQWAETSSIMGLRGPHDPLDQRWYRDLHIPTWVWLGADAVRVQGVLARLAMAPSPRTQDAWLDTAIGHRPGNWIYEWNQEAARCQQRGRELIVSEQIDEARSALLRAAHYYTIASYPHLRGDRLAHEAMTLATACYRDAGRFFVHPLKVLEIELDGHALVAHAHLPADSSTTVPAVVLCGGGDQLQTGFYRLFSNALANSGIALITLDFPGVGLSERWPLTEAYDNLLQAVVNAIAKMPQFDANRIGLLGVRMGGSAAIRMALTDSDKLRACVVIGAPVHQLFIDSSLANRLSPMVKDQLASRLRADPVEMSELGVHLRPLSLVSQGLLGRRQLGIPMMVVGSASDALVPPEDLTRMAQISRRTVTSNLSGHLRGRLEQALTSACRFLTEQLGEGR